MMKVSVTWPRKTEQYPCSHTYAAIFADPMSICVRSAMLDSIKTLLKGFTQHLSVNGQWSMTPQRNCTSDATHVFTVLEIRANAMCSASPYLSFRSLGKLLSMTHMINAVAVVVIKVPLSSISQLARVPSY